MDEKPPCQPFNSATSPPCPGCGGSAAKLVSEVFDKPVHSFGAPDLPQRKSQVYKCECGMSFTESVPTVTRSDDSPAP
jgi:hypothetical protein